MEQEKLELYTRIAAIEYVVTQIGAIACEAAGVSSVRVGELKEELHDKLTNNPMHGLHPAWSDHVSDEIASYVKVLLTDVEVLVALRSQRK